VYEEGKAGIPGWGADVTAGFLRAFKAGLLVKVSSMNDGFMRPSYAEQLLHSYYQASLLCEMIVAQNGERALTTMLTGYRDGKRTEEIFRSALNATPEQLDEKFEAYVNARFRSQLASVGAAGVATQGRGGQVTMRQEPDSGDFARAMAAGMEARQGGNSGEATRQFQRAITLFPEYAEPDSPYIQLAGMLAERDDFKGAAEQLARHNAINENSYATYTLEAELREKAGDVAGAAKVLDRAMYIYPYDMASHEKLAALAGQAGDRKMVVRERRAIVALKPVDMAEAYYQLAQALFDAGDVPGARREVLRSLETAPNFSRAQDLLLRIRGGNISGRRNN
jgi:tetratricopeptide (TPR) repeat protein